MSIFETIIEPFIFIIRNIFTLSYELTNNYGWAIILLSFGVSLLLLPIFIFIEKAKKKDDAIKDKMQSRIDEIKRVYKGQERYYYIKTLNRQFNYSPLKALIPILSLIIQIPFFIAAYQYLAEFEPLTGISFGFIKDLSQPDYLFGGLNFLPLAMTIVNLITAWFYTRYGDKTERKQMLIVAGIFLVLLFNLPSGLVLYWTMNNVFSFFRLFGTNPEVFKGVNIISIDRLKSKKEEFIKLYPKLKITFFIIFGIALISQLNWAFNHSFNYFYIRLLLAIIASTIGSVSIGIIGTFYQIEYNSNDKIRTTLINIFQSTKITFITIAIIGILVQLNWALVHNFDNFYQRITFTIIASSIFTYLLASIAIGINRIKIIPLTKIITNNTNTRLYLKAFKAQLYTLKWLFIVILLIGLYTQINWAINHSFNNITIRILFAIVSSFCLIIFGALFYNILNKFYLKIIALNIPQKVYILFISTSLYFYFAQTFHFSTPENILQYVSFIIIIISQIISINFHYKNIFQTKVFKSIIESLLLILFLFQLIILYALIIGTDISIELFTITINVQNINATSFVLIGLVFSSIPLFSTLLKTKRFEKTIFKHNRLIYILAAIYLPSLILLWHPIIVFNSSPDSFNFDATSIIIKNLPLFAISATTLSVLYFAFKKARYYITIGLLTLTLLAFYNIFISPINMGTLQMRRFSDINNLDFNLSTFIFDYLLIVFFIWGIIQLIRKHKTIYIAYSLLIINTIPIVQTIYYFQENSSPPIQLQNNSSSHNISFSKEQQNVVVIMTDMFQGWYVQRIFESDTNVMNDYKGFTWFPNTVSTTNYTIGSMPTILGGFDFDPGKLNNDTTLSLRQKTNFANMVFRDKAKSLGYHFTSTEVPYSRMDKNTIDTYLPLWHEDWDHLKASLNIGKYKEMNYALLWQNALFFSAPSFIKPKIYNNGDWMLSSTNVKDNAQLAKHYNFVRALPFISDIKNTKPNLTLICTKASHFPWDIVDNDGKLHQNVTPFENNKWTLQKFAEWMKWMKDNDIYDNTKIIIVSDHGIRDTEITEEIMNGNPYKGTEMQNISTKELLYYNPLLMVKDFDSQEEFNTNMRFMNIADVPDITFNEENSSNKQSLEDRIFKSYKIYKIRPNSKQFNIHKIYTIKNNVFDINNWHVEEFEEKW